MDTCFFVTDGALEVISADGPIADLTGWRKADLLGRSLLELHPERDRERIRRIGADVLRTGARPGPVIVEVITPTGDSRWVAGQGTVLEWQDGRPYRLAIVWSRVTIGGTDGAHGRRAPDDGPPQPGGGGPTNVRNLLAKAAGDCHFLLDGDYTITRTSGPLEPLIGWHPDEIIGKCLPEFICEEDQTHLRAHIADVTAQQAGGRVVLRAMARDGGRRWITCACDQLRGADGAPIGWVAAWSPAHPPDTVDAPVGADDGNAAPDGTPVLLTNHQQSVLRLLAMGLRNREIAEALCIEVVTVKYHLTHIYKALGVTNRTAAMHEAIRLGLVDAHATRAEE